MKKSEEYKLVPDTLNDICEELSEKPSDEIREEIKELFIGMARVMVEGNGMGLAANQVGSTHRVIIISTKHYTKGIINPVIEKFSSQTVCNDEGCLSFPGQSARVTRAKQITISGLDESWQPFREKLRGIESVVAQHEVDHLNGLTIFTARDRITKWA